MPDIHFLTGHQVIQGANAVPSTPHAKALVDEKLLDAGVVVLSGPCPAHGLPVRVHVLHPFTLADRIEDQNHIAQAREPLAEGLICINGLAIGRMPARGHHARTRESPPLRNVEIRRHQELWTAFEENILDLVGIPLHDLRHAGIEWCLFGIGSEGCANFSPDGLDIGFGVGPRR